MSIWREYKFNFSFGTFHRYSTHLALLRQVYLREYTFSALNRPDIFYSTHASPTHASAASAMHTWIVHTQSLCTQCLLSRIISKSHDHNICRTKFPTFLSPELCCWINLLILFRLSYISILINLFSTFGFVVKQKPSLRVFDRSTLPVEAVR